MDDTDYVLGRTNAEYDRLIEQAEVLRPLTERTLRAGGIGPGMHVLDIGCGVGDVSFLVSELVGPQGSVVGIDLDGEALRFADERRAARTIANVVFRKADARSVQSKRLFDAAVGRFVLMYMSDPTAALRLIAEMGTPRWHRRIPRVGGGNLDGIRESTGSRILPEPHKYCLRALRRTAGDRSGTLLADA